MSKDKTYYRFLNIMRAYCALLIVFIHMGLGNENPLITCMTRQGVPFFFLVSGFFFSKKLRKSENARHTIIQYIKPVLCVYFVWVLLWLPSTVIEYSSLYSGSVVYLAAVLVRRILFAGIAPYWYLLVLAESAVLLTLVSKPSGRLLGWILSVTGLILSAVYHVEAAFHTSGIVYRTFYAVFSWNNNVVMTGFPLLFLGFAADRQEARLHRLSFRVLLVLYLLSVAFAFAVFYALGHVFVFPFGILQAVLLFLMSLSHVPFQESLSDVVCLFARNYSSVLFLSHTVFLTVLGKVFNLWDLALRYIITVIGAVLLLLLIERLNWPPLNKLFMLKRPVPAADASPPRQA